MKPRLYVHNWTNVCVLNPNGSLHVRVQWSDFTAKAMIGLSETATPEAQLENSHLRNQENIQIVNRQRGFLTSMGTSQNGLMPHGHKQEHQLAIGKP